MVKKAISIHEAAAKGKAHLVSKCLRGDDGVHPDSLDSKEQTTALWIACWHGHLGVIDVLIKEGADPNIRCGPSKMPALVVAVHKNPKVVQELVKLGADVNVRDGEGCTALWHVADEHTAWGAVVAKILLDAGADSSIRGPDGHTLLLKAVSVANHEFVRVLVEGGASVTQAMDDLTPLMVACTQGHLLSCRYLCEAGGADPNTGTNGVTCLMAAVICGSADVVRYLCQAGADTERKMSNGETALTLAASEGHAGVVRILCEAGANAHVVHEGRTPLMIAADEGNLEVVRSLCTFPGADMTARVHRGHTAFMWAAGRGHQAVVDVLMKAGAGTPSDTVNGRTAMMVASTTGRIETVRRLIKAGSEINKIGAAGETALSIASQMGHREVVRELLRAGARVNGGTSVNKPVVVASREGHVEIVRDLLGAGAIPTDDRPNSTTALHAAASLVHLKVVQVLLEHGCLETRLDVQGTTPADVIGKTYLFGPPVSARDPSEEGCMRRLLARGPTFRARSWLWPADNSSASNELVAGGGPHMNYCGRRLANTTAACAGGTAAGKFKLPVVANALRERRKSGRPLLDVTKAVCR